MMMRNLINLSSTIVIWCLLFVSFLECSGGAGGNALKVVSILPREESGAAYVLSVQTPITVIFNRPVIRLGEISNYFPFHLKCNVPVNGTYRWVTTSIARFDVDNQWTSDLNCTFSVDENMVAYDGVRLEGWGSVGYITDPPSIYISDVLSNHTNELTGGHWMSSASGQLANGTVVDLYEVPPDGVIKIQCSVPTDNIQKAMVIRMESANPKSSAGEIPYKVVDCPVTISRFYRAQTNNLCIQIKKPLEVGKVYQMIFQAGSQISKSSGYLSKTITLDFVGLYPFLYVLKDYSNFEYTNLKLFQRHGLANGVDLEMVQRAFSISPSVANLDISLEGANQTSGINDYVIKFSGRFKPNTNYTLSIKGSPSIKDGWGLQLQSHAVRFRMGDAAHYFDSISSNTLFLKSDNVPGYYSFYQNLQDLTCYENDTQVPIYNVTISGWSLNVSNFKEAMLSAARKVNLMGKPDQILALDPKLMKSDTAYMVTLNTDKLFGDSDAFFEILSQCTSEVSEARAVVRSSISVIQMNGVDNSQNITYSITSTNAPFNGVKNARVEFYSRKRDTEDGTDDFVLTGSGVTDARGIATLQMDQTQERYGYVVVHYGQDKIFFEEAYYTISDPVDLRSEYITDRQLYNAGDIIHLKGYLKGSSLSHMKMTVTAHFTSNLIEDTFKSDIKNIDSVFGSFSMDIPIPVGTDPRVYTIEINGEADSSSFYSSKDITVSDSKLPTGILSLESNLDFIALSDLSFHLNVSTVNYLGLPQNGQNVTLTWVAGGDNLVGSDSSDPSAGSPTGVINVLTDANGLGAAVIPLPSYKSTLRNGDSVRVDASYIDPSGTKVVSTSILKYISKSKYILRQRSINPDQVPNLPTPGSIEVIELPGLDQVKDVPIQVDLWQEKHHNTKIELSIDQVEKKKSKYNIIHLGEQYSFKTSLTHDRSPPDFYFVLPYYGEYVLRVSADIPDSDSNLSEVIRVGSDEKTWLSRSWSVGSDLSVYTEKEYYNSNDAVKLEFLSLFNNSKVIMQYGCIGSVSYKEFDGIQVGLNKLSVWIPKACGQYIVLSGVLISNEFAIDLLPGFPVSRSEFSPTHQVYRQIFNPLIKVKNDPKLDLSISVDRADKHYSPGDHGTLSIQIRDKSTKKLSTEKVEVCVFMVDKRNLDLLPNPISTGKSLWENFIYSMPISFTKEAIEYYQFIQRAYQRLKMSPFVSTWYNFDLYDTEFDDQYFTYLNDIGNQYRSFNNQFEMDFAAPKAMRSSQTTQSETTNQPKLRNNFQTTPLFVGKIIVNGDGKATLPFQLPDDLTTFDIRVYAMQSLSSASAFEFLSSSLDIINSKNNTIQPILPSFVRFDDQFTIGVTLVTDKQDKQSFTLSLGSVDLQTNIVLTEKSEKQIQTAAYSTNFFWKLRANTISTNNTFIVKLMGPSGNVLDSTIVSLDVIGKVPPFYIGTSMAVDNSTGVEGFILPQSLPGSGSLTINAGVDRYPSIQLKIDRLLSENKGITPSSIDLVSKQCTFGVLNSYQYNTSLIEKAKDTLAAISISFENYKNYNSIRFLPNTYSGDITATIYTLYQKNILELSGFDGWSIINLDTDAIKTYIQNYLDDLVTKAKNSSTPIDKELIGKASIALDHFWSPSDPDLAEIYGWNALVSNISDSCGLMCQIYFSISAISRGEDSKFIPIVLQNIENSVRVQGRTAYVEAGSRHSSLSLTTHAAFLMILSNSTSVLLEKMINFIDTGGVVIPVVYSDYYPIPVSPEDQAFSIITLALYDSSKSSNNPSTVLRVYQSRSASQTNTIISHPFNSSSHQPLTSSLPFSQLWNNTKLSFESKGKGQVSIAVGISYEPRDLPKSAINSGVIVEKVILDASGKPIPCSQNASSSGTLKQGSQIKILISITTRDDISDLFILDSIASGISPLDSNVYKDDTSNLYYSNISPDTPFHFYQPFQFKETSRERVIYHSNGGLLSGSYQVDYDAIASYSGTFTLPPTKVYSSNQPEFYGFSNSCQLTIIN